MALSDILERKESKFFSHVFTLEIDYFNRDISFMLRKKVSVVRPSFEYLTSDKIRVNLPHKFIKIDSVWKGDAPGQTFIIIPFNDVKIICGHHSIMSTDDIQKTFNNDLTSNEKNVLKEVTAQLNNSMDDALRESFSFNVKTTLRGFDVISWEENADVLNSIFTESGYLITQAVLKLSGFSEGFLYQFIPVALFKKVLELQKMRKAAKDGGGMTVRRILIVDDEADMRERIKEYLSGQGFEFLEAHDGIEAMQVLIRNKVNLIILDIEMPNLNGLETGKRIKQNPRTKNIPIIMCSTKSNRESVITAVDCGACDFIVKPFDDKDSFQAKILKYMKL